MAYSIGSTKGGGGVRPNRMNQRGRPRSLEHKGTQGTGCVEPKARGVQGWGSSQPLAKGVQGRG